MGLATFIRSNQHTIVREWEMFARTLSSASGMTRLQLEDHIKQLLEFVANDLESAQSAKQQFDKSRGLTTAGDMPDTAAETHGLLRHDDGFDIMEMVSEYRALRASIIKLWAGSRKTFSTADVIDLTRFNESMDQALSESVVKFSQKVDLSKDLLLGVLGHDIRSPLATIHMSAEILKRTGKQTEREVALITQIESSTIRVRSIVTDLLDLARARLGTGIPLIRAPMCLTTLCENIVAELQVQHLERLMRVELAPNVTGNWDAIRLGQVLSNLLSNAMQYGAPETPLSLFLTTTSEMITLSVHNEGDPIPRSHLESVFESFTRAPGKFSDRSGEQNLGLRLFISREIVNAHGGTISATSGKTQGTTFSIKLPVT